MENLEQKSTIFTKRLPGWIFVVAMFFAAVAVVLIAWASMSIIADIDKTSTSIANASQNTIRPDQVAAWKTYTNEELGIELKYPTTYETNLGINSDLKAKYSRVSVYDKERHDLFVMSFVSKYYVMPNLGVGCILPYYDQEKPINLGLSDKELEKELNKEMGSCGDIIALKRIKLDSREAVRFYGISGGWGEYDISEYVVVSRTTVMNQDFYNILISGPMLTGFLEKGENEFYSKDEINEKAKSLLTDNQYLGILSANEAAKTINQVNVFNQILSTFKFIETEGQKCVNDLECKEIVCPGGGFVHERCINNECILNSDAKCSN